ncbi:hypothetical protein B0H10DRAFT_2226605 [Mycena sp. CBHHK59/15]|nr:hypothetical protein B0H10DRAFT_2226605 [Mycena sp. CBHHK59/15]
MTSSSYIRYYMRLSLYLAIMCLCAIVGAPVTAAMAVVGRRFEAGRIVTRSFYHIITLVLGLRIEFEGAEHLATQPAVLMLNHQSVLDMWLLGSVLPHQASVMAKKSLQWSPLGPVLFLSGSILVERGSGPRAVASIRAAGALLRKRGVSLVVFPEGTRNSTRAPSLLPFKKGGFHMAVQSGLPIVPTVCENYSHLYRRGVFESGTLRVRVLPPIQTADLGAEDVPALTARVQEQMLEAVREISHA